MYGGVLIVIPIVLFALLGASLLLGAFIMLFNRVYIYSFLAMFIAAVFITPFVVLCYEDHEIRDRGYDVTTTLPLNNLEYKIHPHVYIQKIGSNIQQSIWGKLTLHITLPTGGEICGYSSRVTFYQDLDGKFSSLQIFYEPDLKYYHANSVDDVIRYWKSKGKDIQEPALRNEKSGKINLGPYNLEIGQTDGFITFQLIANK